MNTRSVSIQVLVLAYSMFGVIGFSSKLFAPSPITYAIGSGLILFSYSCIAVLSKKLSFKQLFVVLVPLNILNIISAYASLAYTYMKYQPLYDSLFQYADVVIYNAKNNITTPTMREYFNTTDKSFPSLEFEIPYIDKISSALTGLPDWVWIILLVLIIGYVAFDLVLKFLENVFTTLTYPVIIIALSLMIIKSDLPTSLIYFIPQLWIPIAATFDSFLRIYILRALFFRFMRNHPYIKQHI